MTSPGMNDVMNGVVHPWLTPAHVLIMLGLALLIGQDWNSRVSFGCKVFGAIAACALGLTMMRWVTGVPAPVLIGIALVAGGLVALEARLPLWATGILMALAAAAIGLDSGLETGTVFQETKTLLGTWLSLMFGLFYLAHLATLAIEKKRQWLRIGLRVAGSWIVAISLLMLAFALRKP